MCVSKSWCALIQSSTFVSHHLHRSRRTGANACLLIKCLQDQITRKNVVLSLIPDHSHDHEVLDLPLNLGYLLFSKHEELKNLYILGACINGIVCFYDNHFHGNIIFWNLAMREFKVLIARLISYPPGANYDVEGLGFGYDPKADDYKLVRMVYIREVHCPLYPLLIEVYNLRTNSWRKIELVLKASSSPWGRPGSRCSELLIWDVKIEKSIAILNDSIALIVRLVEGTEKSFDIWVITLGFGKNGQLLMVDDNGELVFCNLDCKQIKNLHVKGDIPHTLQVINYVETLVSVQGENLA
ncbi:hypothetical protein F2P56_021274 [Juglans regia]|uniref:F-box associated beta-propeller type 1 domain-containing protein n=1 Tax=Juglans regia TaxID=51240 RepID=A0A833TXR1_JUGRE|nr:hypothetical protein F2P56_021274 [Juglans regia]